MKKEKIIIGRNEIVSFPDLGIESIVAKIDTGAYSTAIHTHRFWTEEREGVTTLFFQLLDPNTAGFLKRVYSTTNFYLKKVRSSNGRIEERYIIKTPIILGGKKRITHLGLTNREKMKFPVLVGRKVLAKGFLVDVTQSKHKLIF